jgi:predicted DNA-binding transcriptional regulator AlpA
MAMTLEQVAERLGFSRQTLWCVAWRRRRGLPIAKHQQELFSKAYQVGRQFRWEKSDIETLVQHWKGDGPAPSPSINELLEAVDSLRSQLVAAQGQGHIA